jgi:hypothetical protein
MADGSVQNELCSVMTAEDGTCLPSFNSSQLGAFGICYLGGTASTGCDPRLPYDAGALCTPGSICVAGACLTVCNPGPTGCADAGSCVPINDNPSSGVCVLP